MDPELFLRGVTKRYKPPFTIVDTRRRGPASQQISRWNLLDGDGNVIKRFARWRYAYSALAGMCARTGVDVPNEEMLRKWARDVRFANLRSKQDKRSHHRREEATRRVFRRRAPARQSYLSETQRQREREQIRLADEAYARRFKAKYGYDPPPNLKP